MPAIESDLKNGENVVYTKDLLREDDAVFDASTRPALADAIDLITGDYAGYEVPFAAARIDEHENLQGIAQFRCLIARDALTIADLLHKRRPDLMRHSVMALGLMQGTRRNPLSEEEPGRIAHELREPQDPIAIRVAQEAGWVFPYYGSVDATPMWLCGVARVLSDDPAFLEVQLHDHTVQQRAAAATEWLLRRLDSPSGFLESTRSNPNGLTNQVWKDTDDAYMHADGRLARGDCTASVETVADAYDALVAVAAMQEAHGGSWPADAHVLRAEAAQLRDLLLEHFWMGDRFALAVERDDSGAIVPLDSEASNQARLLDSHILDGRAFGYFRDAIASTLVGDGLLGECGIRTLSAHHPSYRPGGHHTGSSWPVDGALAVRGLLRHGYVAQARTIGNRIMHSVQQVGGYPEFFRGDAPEHGPLSRHVVDVGDADGRRSRIVQAPQLLDGGTVAAYAWLEDHGFPLPEEA